jgi:hypothetical protein
MKTKVTSTKYEIDLEEIKAMITRELDLAPSDGEITVKFNLVTKQYSGRYADPRDDNSYQEVGSVTVEVKSK